MENNFIQERDKKTLIKLREVKQKLPYFCNEYFLGIETQTTPLTRLNYAEDLAVFFRFLVTEIVEFHNMKVNSISLNDMENLTATHIEMFLEYLNVYISKEKTLTNSNTTKSRKLASIRSMLKYFYKKDKISKNVSQKVSTPRIKEKEIIRLENDEVSKMLNEVETGESMTHMQKKFHSHTSKRDLAIMTLFLGTGIRISELVGLDINDFDFKNLSFVVTRKGGKRSILYFSDEVRYALEDYLNERLQIKTETNAFFLSLQNDRLGVRAVQKLVKKYAEIITPLKHITPHKLRSTYGTNLYRNTNDIYIVAEVLGHKDVNTTKKHYAAISEDIKKSASNKVKLRDE